MTSQTHSRNSLCAGSVNSASKSEISKKEVSATGKPWIWRARFWGHLPQFDLALLNEGYQLVYCNVGGLYGSPKAVERWNAFYKTLHGNHGFAKKAVLEGMSCGCMSAPGDLSFA